MYTFIHNFICMCIHLYVYISTFGGQKEIMYIHTCVHPYMQYPMCPYICGGMHRAASRGQEEFIYTYSYMFDIHICIYA